MLVSLRSHDTCVNRYSGSRRRGGRSAAYLFVDVPPLRQRWNRSRSTPLVHPSATSRSFTTHLPRPCRGLYSCHGTGYSAGIPDTEAKGNDVFAGIDVISHVIPVCSYMRESRAYHERSRFHAKTIVSQTRARSRSRNFISPRGKIINFNWINWKMKVSSMYLFQQGK